MPANRSPPRARALPTPCWPPSISKKSRQTSRSASSGSASLRSNQGASCLGIATAIDPRSSISRRARSSNTPATAQFQSCTRPVISAPRPAAPRIGGRTSGARPSSCLWATCCTTRPTTTCDVAPASFETACDARTLGVPQAGRRIAPPSRTEVPNMAHAVPLEAVQVEMRSHPSGVLLRTIVIGLTAFFTVVDLFATQAILPTLTRAYQVTPAAMGFAVNSSTMGMAVAGLAVSLFSQRINRRLGILISLSILSIPTALLAVAPDLTTFTALRITQGLCMASAFTLTLAYLGEECSAADAGGAFAAYITGNVASNLVGRLISAGVADHLGLASNFFFSPGLNLLGALLVISPLREPSRWLWMEPLDHLPLKRGACTCAIRGCAPPSASGFASCSLSLGPSLTSISFSCVRPCRSAPWPWALCI